ncbi:hypothetical protein EV368DRAFT_69566 [Lentinula lateritia]|uniref:Uncharacterized protein n=1 Tax=Lentinula aff. lateritia TaxID=2804960 RepID=A0ACC1TZ33_9AGAR|nr:hypothetical protein F5876DRAFT_77377 [Lentinula aff. lateritia]KAJ3846872.1 hypothetical protein EV368DRAFT_69566 [Lentinula lateritia]
MMRYETTNFDELIEASRFGFQRGSIQGYDKGNHRIWSPSKLGDEWLDHVYVDTRAGNDIQFSRVVPAVWPPMKVWPALGYVPSFPSSSFDPFADDEELLGPLQDNDSDNGTDSFSNAPSTPAATIVVLQSTYLESTSPYQSKCSPCVGMEITEMKSTSDIGDDGKLSSFREASSRLKALAPKALNQMDLKDDDDRSIDVVAINDVDRFLSRTATPTWSWEQDFKRSSLAKLKQLVYTRYSNKREEGELLRAFRYGSCF